MSNDSSIWYLENLDVSGLFCPQKVGAGQLEESGYHCDYKRGDYIYLPDDHADAIYFICDGRIKIGSFGDGQREITKAILGPGEVFGELALVHEERRRDFAYAMEDSHICILTVEDLKALLREHSGLNLLLMRIMGNRMARMEKRLENLIFKDSRTRVIEFIQDLVRRKGQRVGYEMVVHKFLTHQEIANLTATSRQTVTTILNELRNKDILTFNRKRLLVRDMELLAREISG